MKTAILGYGRQGKKHAHSWRSIGVELDIFTRSGEGGSIPIGRFIPENYPIIVCAVYPLDEQTLLIKKILDSGYTGYLIIEKPITFDKVLLEILVHRGKTIFFIDELFYQNDFPMQNPLKIETSSFSGNDQLNMAEHAMGNILKYRNNSLDYNAIGYTHTQSEVVGYTIYFGSQKEGLSFELAQLNFSKTYHRLLVSLRDEQFLQITRKNYYDFRCSRAFLQYFT